MGLFFVGIDFARFSVGFHMQGFPEINRKVVQGFILQGALVDNGLEGFFLQSASSFPCNEIFFFWQFGVGFLLQGRRAKDKWSHFTRARVGQGRKLVNPKYALFPG